MGQYNRRDLVVMEEPMKMKNKYLMMLAAAALTSTAGCGSKSFNVANEEDFFQQSSTVKSVPVDILWVVDNSGSMETSQQNVANNVASFIDKFTQKNFDYQIAVTTTDAYKGLATHGNDPTIALFRDGERDYYPTDGINDATSSGYHVITPSTPNLKDVFKTNVLQGIYGGGDERSFQSMEAALLNTSNRNRPFPRPGAFLVVIILTDEEDFSWDGTANIQMQADGVTPNLITDSRLHPISRYTDLLDTVTGSTATQKNYMVNAIAIFSEACRAQLATGFSGRRIAERHAQLVDATGGIKASLCDDFSGILSNLSDSILEFSTKFYLSRVPLAGTLEIYVDGVLVPESGYTYNPDDNSVTFQSQYIPAQDADIRVRFTPSTLK
jgi:hypothetical protein